MRGVMFTIGSTGGGGGSGSGSGVKKVADAAARLALSPTDGDMVIQLDNDVVYEYDVTTLAWLPESGPGTALTFTGYDAASVPGTIPGWKIDPLGGGASVDLTYIPVAATGNHDLHRYETEINPTTDTNDDNVVNFDVIAHIDHTGSGHDLGDFRNFQTYVTLEGTGTYGTIYGRINSLVGVNAAGTTGSIFADYTALTVDAGYTVTNELTGYLLTGTIDAAAIVNNYWGYRAYPALEATFNYVAMNEMNPAVDGATINAYRGYITSPRIGTSVAASVNDLQGFTSAPTIGAFATISNYIGMLEAAQFASPAAFTNSYAGFVAQAQFDGVALTNGIVSFQSNLNLGASAAFSASYLNIISLNEQMQANATITGDYTGINMGPTFHAGSSVNNVFGINMHMQLDGTIQSFFGIGVSTGGASALNTFVGVQVNNQTAVVQDFKGIQVSSATAAVSNSATGIDVNMSAITMASGRPSGLNINEGTINAGITLVTVSNIPTVLDFGHQIGGEFHVVSGSAITNTEVILNSFSGTLFAEDSYTSGAFGLGYCNVGFIGQMAVVSGKTVDKATLCVGGASVPAASTGGTITDLAVFRTLGVFSAGGTLSVTNQYGYKVDTGFASLATNAWGVYVGDTGIENYFGKCISIGTTKVTNTDVAFEIGSLKALRLGVLTTTQRNALTALAGMMVYDSVFGSIDFYDGLNSQWRTLSGTNSGDITLAAVGSSPNANGASLSTQVLTLQPADATNPGVIANAAQSLPGEKRFASGIQVGAVTALAANSAFEVTSTTKLSTPMPKMTTTQRNAVSTPTAGQALFNTTTNQPEYYDGANFVGFGALKVIANSAISNAATFTAANNRRQIQQISGNGGAVTLADLATTNAVEGDELFLLGTDDANTVAFNSATNTVLNGSITFVNNTLLHLVFANGKYREVARNN